jgi:hypothetical protein
VRAFLYHFEAGIGQHDGQATPGGAWRHDPVLGALHDQDRDGDAGQITAEVLAPELKSAPGAGDHKDAVFLSPHKFPGGPQTPGVLVVRREPVRNPVPTSPGGGTVTSVDPVGHSYLSDAVAREEGGTPAIVESIRAGLVIALKQAVGTDVIAAAEEQLGRLLLGR